MIHEIAVHQLYNDSVLMSFFRGCQWAISAMPCGCKNVKRLNLCCTLTHILQLTGCRFVLICKGNSFAHMLKACNRITSAQQWPGNTMYTATSGSDTNSMLGCASQRLNSSLHSAAQVFKALVKGASGFQHMHKSGTLNEWIMQLTIKSIQVALIMSLWH